MNVFLERQYKEDCTLGRFWAGDIPIYTLELPWKNNQSNISCIPEGIYPVEKTYSPAFTKIKRQKAKKKNPDIAEEELNQIKVFLWEILDVPKRSGIRIHTANFVRQLKGCIAPGLELFDIDGDGTIDISKSQKALDLLYTLLPDKFTLEIIENKFLNF